MMISATIMSIVADAAGDRRDHARASAEELLTHDELTDPDRACVLAALAFVDYLDGRFADAVVEAERSITLAERSGSDEARLLAHSMRMMAGAGPEWGAHGATDHFETAWQMRGILDSTDVESQLLIVHFLAEGLLATGRLSEAALVHEHVGDLRLTRRPEDEARTPFPPFMLVQRSRILLFQGAMLDAQSMVGRAIADAHSQGNRQCQVLAEAFAGLIRAHLDDTIGARAAARRTAIDVPSPRGLLETGAWIVSAYALFAIGDREQAAECVTTAGIDEALSALQVIDRSLGYDILVADALERDDLARAQRWGELSLPLAAHPAASLVVEQSISRLDAARGEALPAAERAEVAAARARLTGRYLDAARADLMQARALVAAGQSDLAIRRLTTLAHDAQDTGVPLLQRSATRELRQLGRRLPPRRGGGWSSLSEREQQIAILASEGFSNRVIGSSLFLSERTVQSYISRILTALGVPSRSGLPTIVPHAVEDLASDRESALTPRQYEVAHLVAQGLSNRELADTLDISVKTAEKHIGEILRRWGLSSRTGIAHVMASGSARRAS